MRDVSSPQSDPDAALTERLAATEFRELRATVRERGTLRLFVAVITFVAWATLLLIVTLHGLGPAFLLVSLIPLAAGFESVYAAHVGVERIGRYIQTRYETLGAGSPDWEHVAMRLGLERAARTGVDPLFSKLFAGGAVLNLLPLTATNGLPTQPVVAAVTLAVALVHVGFLVRLSNARRFSTRQREVDLELLRTLGEPPHRD